MASKKRKVELNENTLGIKKQTVYVVVTMDRHNKVGNVEAFTNKEAVYELPYSDPV